MNTQGGNTLDTRFGFIVNKKGQFQPRFSQERFRLSGSRSDGDTPEQAHKIPGRQGVYQYSGNVGAKNLNKFYRLTLKQACKFSLTLTGLSADADVALLNKQGRVINTSLNRKTASEKVVRDLAAGTYYLQICPSANRRTAYRLRVAETPSPGTIAQTEERNHDRVVVEWNKTLLKAIQQVKPAPPVAARNLAIVHTAIYDAVNSVLNFGSTYHIKVKAPKGASAEAAAAEAAYQTLVSLFPTQKSLFDAQLTASLSKIPDGQAEQDGISVGKAVADDILTWRSTDGASKTVAYTPLVGRGYWQPTPSGFAPALLPQWRDVTPFGLTSGGQFRPDAPPAVDSPEYAAELNTVRSIGRKDSTTRTAVETEIALFWADGGGTATPPGHWNRIAEQVAIDRRTTLSEDARLFAMLNVGLADAGIAAWDAKYTFNQWRPVTAINQELDSTWQPLIATPPFPDYISGHSTFSAAASTILTNFFGDRLRFSTDADAFSAIPGTIRSYKNFAEAAQEAGISRIYGGIHMPSSNAAGLETGNQVGTYVVSNFLFV